MVSFRPWLITVFAVLLLVSGALLFQRRPAASRADVLTVYTTLEQNEVDAYLPDFQLAYPEIQIELVRLSTGVLTERIFAERAAPQADVLWGVGLTSLLLFEWNDMLKPYAPVGLAHVDPRFHDTRRPPYWVGANVTLTAFCVNQEEAERHNLPIPHSWDELRDPRYRRHLVMPNPATSGTGLMALLGILHLYDQEEDGWRYLDELHKNIAFYPNGGAEPCRLVDNGSYAIGIAKTFADLGNVEMVYPTEKSGWELAASALMRKDPIQPTARLFLDWAISESAVRLYAHKSAITVYKTGLALPPGFPTDPEGQLLDKDAPWDAANRDRIVAEWLRRYGDKVQEGE